MSEIRKIKKVRVENFKSHEVSEIEFDDKVTAFTGKTNSGKTAFLTALNWALYNEPSGDKFIRHGKQYARVVVEFSDGRVLERIRGKYEGKNENLYIIRPVGAEPIELTKFGTGPLEEVLDFHGIRKVNLFSQEESLNVCTQFEPPFFLGETPSKQAEMVGKLGNVHIVDHASKLAASELRALKEENKMLLQEQSRLELDLEQIPDLSGYKSNTKKAEELIRELKNKIALLKEIERLKHSLTVAIKEVRKLDEIVALEGNINAASELVKSINKDVILVSSINTTASNINRNKAQLEAVERIINVIDDAQLNEAMGKVKDVSKALVKLESIRKTAKQLEKQTEILENSDKKIETLSSIAELEIGRLKDDVKKLETIVSVKNNLLKEMKVFNKTEDELNQLEEEIKLMEEEYAHSLLESGVCPTCKRNVDKDYTVTL